MELGERKTLAGITADLRIFSLVYFIIISVNIIILMTFAFVLQTSWLVKVEDYLVLFSKQGWEPSYA